MQIFENSMSIAFTTHIDDWSSASNNHRSVAVFDSSNSAFKKSS